jgi:protocatechuate 3,4-dioxygenase beta subunit
VRTKRLSRRDVLAAIAPVAAVAAWWRWGLRSARAGEPDDLVETPSNDEGPFYREKAPLRSDLRVAGSKNAPIAIQGVVQAEDRKPLAGVTLDLWHADASGAYDMESADFRHRGKVRTDRDGRYSFKTNLPGRYGFWNGTARPRHIHVKLSGPGLYLLTTQLYFAVRAGIDAPEELVVPLTWTGAGRDRAGTGTWNAVLSRRK